MRWTLIALLLIGAVSAPANDQLGELDSDFDMTGGSVVDARPTALVVVGQGGGELAAWRPSGGGGSGSSIQCGYYNFAGVEGTYHYGVDESAWVTPEDGDAYIFACYTASGVRIRYDVVVFDAGDPFAGMYEEERALDLALSDLALPDPSVSTSPPVGADHLVGLPTWVWHDGGWQPLQATATIGAVSATVTATPSRLEIDPGDGSGVRTCSGPGTPYRPGGESDCSHTWVHRSTVEDPDGVFTLSVTVHWEVAWTSTTGGGGELGALESTQTVDVRVLEAQAMISY